MIVVYCQHRDALTSAERRMVAGLRDLPGVLLVNALVTTGRRTREIDGVWIHPGGVVAIEAKGTAQSGVVAAHQNGPWTIGGQAADFTSGPNPLLQARSAAQTLRHTLTEHGVEAGFLPAVVALAGTRLEWSAGLVGDMVVVRVEDLPRLPAFLQPGAVGTSDVAAILEALDLGPDARPDAEELAGEGFVAGSPLRARPAAPATSDGERRAPADGSSTSRDRRRARRFADLEAQAHDDWRRSHRRRLVASIIAAAVLAGYLPQLPTYCLLNGLLCGAIAGAYQLAVRRRLSGPRDRGRAATLLWLVTLLPIVGIGASLAWVGALPALAPITWPFVLMLAILTSAGLGCAVLAGRSGYVHPPAIVIERYDERGRPTGAFMLAQANPLHFPGKDWRPAELDTPAR